MKSSQWYALIRIFVSLAGCTLGLFIAIGIGSMMQAKLAASPVSSMKGLTGSVPGEFFEDMMKMEMAPASRDGEPSTFSGDNVVRFLFRFVTGIHPDDPRSLLAMEVPGLSNDSAVLLRSGQATDGSYVYPMEYTPSEEMLRPASPEGPGAGGKPETGQVNGEDPEPLPGRSVDPDIVLPDDLPKTDENPEKRTTEGRQVVFIYHSHNRESWLPELEGKSKMNEAFDPEINVTLLGKRMAENLEKQGIGAVSSDVDYPSSVPGYNWNFSYKYSLETIRKASADHPHLEYYFDIHRDAQKRELTTATIDGVDYAQLYFIIGHKNPDWEKNEAFASELHKRMEARYPGISRGVWSKTANTGHAEYNQSVSPNSILIEVGGPENTLEESYRTIDALSDVIADYYWEQQDAEKANAGDANVNPEGA